MLKVFVHKAKETGGTIDPVTLNITGEVPENSPEIQYQDAKNIEELFFQTLPGGTYNHLVTLMMKRKNEGEKQVD